jgi:hypothetical protein
MRGTGRVRLVVFDETDVVRGPLVPRIERRQDGTAHGTGGLTRWWRLGAVMHRLVRHADATTGASSWEQALSWATSVARDRRARIAELQIWGHGGWGYTGLGQTRLDREALSKSSPLAGTIDAFGGVLADDALFWVRCCSTFGAPPGRAFAPALAERLSARVAGHTFIIGGFQSGAHSLAPGQAPAWDPDEGIERRSDAPPIPLDSSLGAPNTLSCLRLSLPRGW